MKPSSKGLVVKYNETKQEILLTLRKPSLRYLDWLLRINSGEDILRHQLFPNAKEVTESVAAYFAVRKNLSDIYKFDDPSVLVVVVGDGTKPRTGAIFAYMTKWTVVSVDPIMQTEHGWNAKIDRLHAYKARIEDTGVIWGREDCKQFKKLIIVSVHGHAKLTDCLEVTLKIDAEEATIISIPCCIEDDLAQDPDKSYIDWSIWSEHRLVNIYRYRRYNHDTV